MHMVCICHSIFYSLPFSLSYLLFHHPSFTLTIRSQSSLAHAGARIVMVLEPGLSWCWSQACHSAGATLMLHFCWSQASRPNLLFHKSCLSQSSSCIHCAEASHIDAISLTCTWTVLELCLSQCCTLTACA